MAERGVAIGDRSRTPGERMAEPTRAAKPRCRQGAVPGAGATVKPQKKAFYLLSMKPPKDPAPNNNNNVSFVIHCQLGKEIKHICSNCSRGEDGRDGECPARQGGGGKVALPVHGPGCWRNLPPGQLRGPSLPTARPCTLQSVTRSQWACSSAQEINCRALI